MMCPNCCTYCVIIFTFELHTILFFILNDAFTRILPSIVYLEIVKDPYIHEIFRQYINFKVIDNATMTRT